MSQKRHKRRRSKNYHLIVGLDATDQAHLERISAHERLSRAATLRRLIREQARRLDRALRAATQPTEASEP